MTHLLVIYTSMDIPVTTQADSSTEGDRSTTAWQPAQLAHNTSAQAARQAHLHFYPKLGLVTGALLGGQTVQTPKKYWN